MSKLRDADHRSKALWILQSAASAACPLSLQPVNYLPSISHTEASQSGPSHIDDLSFSVSYMEVQRK